MDRGFEGRRWSSAFGVRGRAILLACIGVALTLGVVAPSAAGPAPSFASRAYRTGDIPASVAIGDLNGDGKGDLATANGFPEPGTVSVLINKGDGSFEPRLDYATGYDPGSLAIGDLNGDGKQDLAIASFDGVTVRLNKGQRRFPRRDYDTGNGPFSVAIGDLNGDRKPDLATANLTANSVSVLTNNGDGTFQPHMDYATGREPESVAIGDLNGDGRGDLAVVNNRSDTVSVFLSRGDGSFKTRLDYGTRRAPRSVAIGDLNGDRKPDLAIANNGSNTVSAFLNRGGGGFGARRDYRTGRAPLSVVIGDLNGDRKPDLATVEAAFQDLVSVLLNRGDGSFEPRRDYRTGEVTVGGAEPLAIGDLNGDRKPDLATPNINSTVSVLLNATGLCAVPNLRGKTLPAAKLAIARAGCRVGTIRRAYSKTVKGGRVISQKPRFGRVLPKGGKVNLVVSRGRTTS